MNTEFRFWPPGPISCATSGRFVATLSSILSLSKGRNDERLTFLAKLKNAGTTETYLAMQ